jgi:hypothetical protein
VRVLRGDPGERELRDVDRVRDRLGGAMRRTEQEDVDAQHAAVDIDPAPVPAAERVVASHRDVRPELTHVGALLVEGHAIELQRDAP